MKQNTDEMLRPESRRDMRSLAFHYLYAVDRFDYTLSLEEIIERFKQGFKVEVDPDSLAVTMARGAIEMREELDEQIKPLLRNWRLERLGCCTRPRRSSRARRRTARASPESGRAPFPRHLARAVTRAADLPSARSAWPDHCCPRHTRLIFTGVDLHRC